MLRPAETHDRRRLTGALPILAALALVAGVVLVVSPAARHEVAMSTGRAADPFVELYFADEAAARACPVQADRQTVSARVRSHLRGSATVPYVIQVTEQGRVGDRVTGEVATSPSTTADLTGVVSVPASGEYDVDVVLGDGSERLVVHCGEPGGDGA